MAIDATGHDDLPTQLQPHFLASCDMAGFASTLNVSALKWLGPEALAIQVQVPYSTSYGPNSCNYKVFDIAVPSGRILHS